ncbi:MAG: HTH domain-containing protein [Oscillibacter sp.]|nr:HTH domain-containing protein [Oscillibacter sp.]
MFTQLDYMEKRGSGLRKMRELTEKLPNFLPGKEPHYKTEVSSFFTTFYNLNWNEAGNIPVKKVAQRANITLNEFSVNKESSERKFGEAGQRSKNVGKTAQKIIDLVISDPSISAEAMASNIGISPRAVEKQIAKLRIMGILTREGATKAGYWRIITNSQ